MLLLGSLSPGSPLRVSYLIMLHVRTYSGLRFAAYLHCTPHCTLCSCLGRRHHCPFIQMRKRQSAAPGHKADGLMSRAQTQRWMPAEDSSRTFQTSLTETQACTELERCDGSGGVRGWRKGPSSPFLLSEMGSHANHLSSEALKFPLVKISFSL